jgi:hypothetical protein
MVSVIKPPWIILTKKLEILINEFNTQDTKRNMDLTLKRQITGKLHDAQMLIHQHEIRLQL